MKWINWILAIVWGITFVMLIVQPKFILSQMDKRSHREFFEKAAKDLNIPVEAVRKPTRNFAVANKQQMDEFMEKVQEYRRKKNETIRLVLFGFISSLIGLGFVLNRAYQLKRKHHLILSNQHELIQEQHMQLKQAMEELGTSRAQLEEANRAKDKMFSIIAHDLKNPFHNLMAFSEVLVKFGDRYSPDKVARFHKNIYNASRQTYGLLENLLDWSRSQMGRIHCQPRNVNLMDIAEEILGLYADRAEKKKVRLVNAIDPHDFAIIDPDMLRTILRNLVGNAVKYTEGGKVELKSRRKEGFVQFVVRDTGVGMSREKIDGLFKLTEQVSTYGTQNEPGTGLGLLLSREFALKNGGDITVKSEPGKGSEFILSIQCSEGITVLRDNELPFDPKCNASLNAG